MKTNLTKITAITLLATAIIFSCKKKEETPQDTNSTNSTTGGTTTGGSTTGGTTGGNNLQANSFTFNGRAFTTTTLNCNKSIYGTVNYQLLAFSADTTYVLNFSMPKYLPPTYTGVLATASSTFSASNVGVGLTRQKPSPYYLDNRYYLSGGTALITNQSGSLTIEVTNAGLNNSGTVSAKISVPIPVIPSANASYTLPNGIADNQFVLGTYTISGQQKSLGNNSSGFNKCKAQLSQTISPTRTVEFNFGQTFPPSGTYTVVSSATNILPGQVFIVANGLNPTYFFNSTLGGTITVVTDEDDVSITAQNILMSDGTTTLSLTGNYKH